MCAKLGVKKYREVRRRGRVEYTVYKRGNIVDILRQEGEHVSYHSRVIDMGNALCLSSIASLFQAKDAYDITLPDIIYVLLFLETFTKKTRQKLTLKFFHRIQTFSIRTSSFPLYLCIYVIIICAYVHIPSVLSREQPSFSLMKLDRIRNGTSYTVRRDFISFLHRGSNYY